MKHLHQTLVGVHTDHLQETLSDPYTKDLHEAIFAKDPRKAFAWDSRKRYPHETFASEVCTRCPHERLEALLRWEEPAIETKPPKNLKNRGVRVRRLKT